jgi:hypothetical protein
VTAIAYGGWRAMPAILASQSRHAGNDWEHELRRGDLMWWGIGIGALLYVVLLVTLGVMTLRNGHGWMFFFGIFFPLLWIIGAIMRPPRQYA